MFKITGCKGFHMEFENGITVSVQFGYGNYCDNYDSIGDMGNEKEVQIQSNTAEVAIWDNNNKWITSEAPHSIAEDDVIGRLTTQEVLDILNWASKYGEESNE